MGAAAGSRELVINDATGQAGQDRREGRQPRAVCDFRTGRGGGAEGAVSEDPEPHRWAAASPFAAMTAAHPVASRSPDRTGLCCAGRSAPSQCEMVTGPGFSAPNQLDQERTTAYRDSSGPNSRSDAHYATIVGDWEEPSGESRLIPFRLGKALLFTVHQARRATGAPRAETLPRRRSRRTVRALTRAAAAARLRAGARVPERRQDRGGSTKGKHRGKSTAM